MRELSVSEVMKITGLSRTTLLYYESKGLIRPVQSRETGYRRYTADDISQVMLYQSVKPLGASIDEYAAAAGVYGEGPYEDIFDLILQKKSEYMQRVTLYVSMWEEMISFACSLRGRDDYCAFRMSKDAWAVPMEGTAPALLKAWGQYFLQRNLSYFFDANSKKYTCGLSCYADCAMPLSYELRSQLTWLPGRPCLLIAAPINLRKEDFSPLFKEADKILEKYELLPDAAPWGTVGCREVRDGKANNFFFLWIPIRAGNSATDFHSLFSKLTALTP